MKQQDRSVLQQTIRETLQEWASAILADGYITEDMRPGYRDVIEAAQDDDDTLDIIIEEHFSKSGLKI